VFWSVLYIALRRVLELVLLRSRSDETKELEIARCQSTPGQGGPLGVRYRGPLAAPRVRVERRAGGHAQTTSLPARVHAPLLSPRRPLSDA
jgi:hypothetical protein